MTFRIISRLDVKPPFVVKGICLEGVRKVGKPADLSKQYSKFCDEIFYQDVVASLYARQAVFDIVNQAACNLFIPLTIGGGIRNCSDIYYSLRNGADKVSINTAAITNPTLINASSSQFGSQCITVNIEAMPSSHPSGWEAMYNSAREHSGIDALDWALEAESRGAGEIVITSVPHEGRMRGYCFDLSEQVLEKVRVPVLLHGGFASNSDVLLAAQKGYSGVLLASLLHYNKIHVQDLKYYLRNQGISVRI